MMASGNGTNGAAGTGNSYKGLPLLSNESFQSRVNAAIQVIFSLSPIRKALLAIPPLADIPELDNFLGTRPAGAAAEKGAKQTPHLGGLARRYGVLKALRSCFYALHVSASHRPQLFALYSMEAFVQDLEDILQYLLMLIAESAKKPDRGEKGSIEDLFKIVDKVAFHTVEDEENHIYYFKESSRYFFRFRVGTPDVKNIYESFADRSVEGSIEMSKEYFDGTEDCEVRSKTSLFLPEVLLIRLHRDGDDDDVHVTPNVTPYEFYEEIDLTKYCGIKSKEDLKTGERQLYTLFAVIAERKDNVMGKTSYPVFSRYHNLMWSKYEDGDFDVTTKEEVFKGNFGTETNGTLAQVLVYIKNSSFDSIGQVADRDEISRQIQKELKRRGKLGRSAPRYKSVMLLTEDTFRENVGLNLFQEPGPLPALHVPIPHSKLVEVRVGVRLARFYEIVAHVLNWEVNRIRIWVLNKCTTRDNVLRPVLLSQELLSSKTFKNKIQDEELMFVEHYAHDPIPTFNIENDCLIFLKEFDGKNLLYLGSLYVPWEMTFDNLFCEILGPNGLQKGGCHLRVYHEIGGQDDKERRDLVKQIEDFSQALVEVLSIDESMGEILIIDWTYGGDDGAGACSEAEKLCTCACLDERVGAAKHIQFLKYRRTVEFVNFDARNETLTLDINTQICCGSLPGLLEQRLGIDIDRNDIYFFACSSGQDPDRVIHHTDRHKVEQLSEFLPSDRDCTYGAEMKVLYRLHPKVTPEKEENGLVCNENSQSQDQDTAER